MDYQRLIRQTMHISQDEKYLHIHWDSGKSTKFWYAWLYDNAPERRHENGQKLTESRSVDMEVKPRELGITEDGLVIHWAEEESRYSLEFLRRSSVPQSAPLRLWRSNYTYQTHNYREIQTNPFSLYELLKDVKESGFAKVENVPPKSGMVLDFIRLFGYPRETNYGVYYDVISLKNPDNLADSNLGLSCHTDNPYREPTPTIQVLHCLKADVEGGETLLVDGFQVAKDLKEKHPAYYELLSNQVVSFQFHNSEHLLQNSAPILELDKKGVLRKIKFNSRSIQPFQVADEIMLPFYEAYQYLENQFHSPDYQLRFKLEPGQAIIYDNERILHGRTAFKVKSERHLQGAYADRDALLSKCYILKEQLFNE